MTGFTNMTALIGSSASRINMTDTVEHPALVEAVRAIAHAEAAYTAAETAAQLGRAELSRVNEALSRLDAKREEILNRRRGGQAKDDDTAQLTFLEADREDLERMQGAAEQTLCPREAALSSAIAHLGRCRTTLDLCKDQAQEDALKSHLDQLQARFLDSLTELHAVSGRLGRPVPVWGSSAMMRDTLRSLAARRREL